MFADPSRGFAPTPPVGTLGTVFTDPNRGFAPAPPAWILGSLDPWIYNLNIDQNSDTTLNAGGAGAKPLVGSANIVPRVPTGGAGAKPLLGILNSV